VYLSSVLITGGAGFIGSAVTRAIVSQTDNQVIVYDKLTYAGNLSSLDLVSDDPLFSFLQADICNREAVHSALFSFQPDVIMHLAAESHVDRSIDGPATFVDTNIVGTFTGLSLSSHIDGRGFRFARV